MSALHPLCQRLKDASGIQLKNEWYQSAIEFLHADQNFAAKPHDQQLQLLFALFLEADMNVAGSGCLPGDVDVSSFLVSKPKHQRRAQYDSLIKF